MEHIRLRNAYDSTVDSLWMLCSSDGWLNPGARTVTRREETTTNSCRRPVFDCAARAWMDELVSRAQDLAVGGAS